MIPRGTTCKCGADKNPGEFFCPACTAQLPTSLLGQLRASNSWDGFRALIRRAVILLDLPQTENARRKKFYA